MENSLGCDAVGFCGNVSIVLDIMALLGGISLLLVSYLVNMYGGELKNFKKNYTVTKNVYLKKC